MSDVEGGFGMLEQELNLIILGEVLIEKLQPKPKHCYLICQ